LYRENTEELETNYKNILNIRTEAE
jgi:hypothetical protein